MQISKTMPAPIELLKKDSGKFKGHPALWLRRHNTRKALKALLQDDPERLLRDLGLHPDSVQRECKKWFWQS